MPKPIEHIDSDSYGVRLFRLESKPKDKILITVSACSKNGGSHVSTSIEIQLGAWRSILQAALEQDKEITDGGFKKKERVENK